MKRSNLFLLSLIVIFGLFIRLVFFTKAISGDDLEYYNFAYKVTQNTFRHDLSFHSPRIGMIYPTALFYNLFGINELTSNLLPLLTSTASIALIFYIGKLMFNENTGMIAAFLLSFFPLNVFYSTTLFPDQPSAFFMALGAFFFLKAEKKNSKSSSFVYLIYLAAGLSAGIAYLIKESSVVILGFFILYILCKKNIKKGHFMILAGFLIIFGLESIYYTIKTSNPFFRYAIVSGQATNIIKTYYPNYFGVNVISRLLLHYPYLIFTNALTAVFYALALISSAYFILKKKKEAYALFIWIAPLAFYLNFGSLSFSQYVPLPADVRYIEIITIPSLLLLSYYINNFEKFTFGVNFSKSSIIALLLITSVYFIAANELRQSSENLYKSAEFLKSAPKKIIYTDPRSAEMLIYIFNFDKQYNIASFNSYGLLDFNKGRNNLIELKNAHDAYVIANRRMINALLKNYKDMEFPKEIKSPPKSWVEKFSYGGGEDRLSIYLV